MYSSIHLFIIVGLLLASVISGIINYLKNPDNISLVTNITGGVLILAVLASMIFYKNVDVLVIITSILSIVLLGLYTWIYIKRGKQTLDLIPMLGVLLTIIVATSIPMYRYVTREKIVYVTVPQKV